MRPRVTIRDVMRVDPVAGVMGTADDRDEALRLAAELAPSGASVEQMASAAAEIIRSRVAQKAHPPPRVPSAPEPPAPEPPLGDHARPAEPDPVEPSPEPGDDAAPAPELAPEPPPAAPARPTKPRK
jgi:hypothetical protein